MVEPKKPEKADMNKNAKAAPAAEPEAAAKPTSSKAAKPQMTEAKSKKYDERAARTSSIIRLAGKDISGTLELERALMNIKGVGFSMAQALVYSVDKNLKIPPTTRLEDLNEDQMSKLEAIIKEPNKFGIPTYLLNRRRDRETGIDMHVVGNDLVFATRQDITKDIALRTIRGYRHQYNQKVRGQHTRSTGRTGATVGVSKKSNKPATSAKKK